MDDSSNFEKILSDYLESDHFQHKVVRHTHKTCKEFFLLIMKPMLYMCVPLLTLLIGLCGYIFLSLDTTVSNLSKLTNSMERNVVVIVDNLSSINERTKNNEKNINLLLRNHYRYSSK